MRAFWRSVNKQSRTASLSWFGIPRITNPDTEARRNASYARQRSDRVPRVVGPGEGARGLRQPGRAREGTRRLGAPLRAPRCQGRQARNAAAVRLPGHCGQHAAGQAGQVPARGRQGGARPRQARDVQPGRLAQGPYRSAGATPSPTLTTHLHSSSTTSTTSTTNTTYTSTTFNASTTRYIDDREG